MADKELRKLSRKELLEVLVSQSRQIDILQEQLDAANKKLNERIIQIESAGSIAEAALKLNHIFEDAEAASRQYLISLESMARQQCS